MTETSTTISEANLQPNCVGKITPSDWPQRPMVAEPEQEEPRWSAAGCDVEQARSAAARIKEHRGRTMAESCAEATHCGLLVTAFGVQHLYYHCWFAPLIPWRDGGSSRSVVKAPEPADTTLPPGVLSSSRASQIVSVEGCGYLQRCGGLDFITAL